MSQNIIDSMLHDTPVVSPVRVFEIHTAIRLHFKEDGRYDFWKFHGQMKYKTQSLVGRRDAWFFERMAKQLTNEEMIIGFFVANRMAGKDYIMKYDMGTYNKWTAHRDAAVYRFKEELDKYLEAKKTSTDPLKLLIEMAISNHLSQEFLIMFNYITDGYIYSQLDKTDNFIWQDLKKSQMRYEPFLVNLWQLPSIKQKLQMAAK